MKNHGWNRWVASFTRSPSFAVCCALAMAGSAWLSGCSSGDDPASNAHNATGPVFAPSDPAGGPPGPQPPVTTPAQPVGPPASTCGNGQIEAGEDCEPGVALTATCESRGFAGGGTLACDASGCRFDPSGCSMDNTVDAGATGDGDGVDGGMEPPTTVETGTLPVPDALDQDGPYEVIDVPNTGPGDQFRLFAPKPLGEDGLKHPVVAWSPGAGAFPDAYLTLLNRLATHGFVTLSYNSTAQGTNLVAAIDWLIAENERPDSMLYGKLDTDHIAAGGHSAGSLATYQMADDKRLTTTLHMSGGSFTPQTDVPKLRAPALMVCGDAGGDGLTTGDIANPMCAADFEMAKVPVFFAVVNGGGHATLNDADATLGVGSPANDPHKLLFIKAMIGWLRWQLADDQSLRPMFVGDDCGLCASDSGYTVKQRDLDQL